jgi:hypothetical protein
MPRDKQRLAAPAVFCGDTRRRYPLPVSPPRNSLDRYQDSRYQLDYPVDYADEIDRYNQLRDRVESLHTVGYGRLCEPRSFLRSISSTRVLEHNDLRRRIEARRQSPQYVGPEEALFVQRTVLTDSHPVELTSGYADLLEPSVSLNDRKERDRKRRKRKRRRSRSKNDGEGDWRYHDLTEPRDTIAALKALASYDTPLDLHGAHTAVTSPPLQTSRHEKSRRRKSRRRLNSYDKHTHMGLDRDAADSSALHSSSVSDWNLPPCYAEVPASLHDSSADTYTSSHSENYRRNIAHNGMVCSKRSTRSESIHSRQSHQSAARLCGDDDGDDDVESGELKSGSCTPVSSVDDADERCRRSRSASAQLDRDAGDLKDLRKDRLSSSTDALCCSGASVHSSDGLKNAIDSLDSSQGYRNCGESSFKNNMTSRPKRENDLTKAVFSTVTEAPVVPSSVVEVALPTNSTKTSGDCDAVDCSTGEKLPKQHVLRSADYGVEKTADLLERFVYLIQIFG